jgi:hypothetical protein
MCARGATTLSRPVSRFTAALALVAGVWLQPDRPAYGHAEFMSCIQHRITARVGITNIDITVELTFFEIRSLAERERMDTNQDKVVTDDEVKAYLEQLAETFNQGIRLMVGGRPVDLAPLYAPEIDLLMVKKVAPCHHVLLLYYFARTPAWLAPGTEVVITDDLWPTVTALCSLEVAGKDGCRFAAGSMPSTSGAVGPWTLSARCVSGPTRQIAPGGRDGVSRARFAGLAATAFAGVVAAGVMRRRRRTEEVRSNAGIHDREA